MNCIRTLHVWESQYSGINASVIYSLMNTLFSITLSLREKNSFAFLQPHPNPIDELCHFNAIYVQGKFSKKSHDIAL